MDHPGGLTCVEEAFLGLGHDPVVGLERREVVDLRDDGRNLHDDATRAGHPQLEALILATRAELALAQGKAQEAVRLAEESAAHPHASAFARANAALIRAQGLAAAGAPLPKVRAAYEQAVIANAREPQARRAQVHESYADVLAARGQVAPAFEREQQGPEPRPSDLDLVRSRFPTAVAIA